MLQKGVVYICPEFAERSNKYKFNVPWTLFVLFPWQRSEHGHFPKSPVVHSAGIEIYIVAFIYNHRSILFSGFLISDRSCYTDTGFN